LSAEPDMFRGSTIRECFEFYDTSRAIAAATAT
jgi:hypothetical protein